MRRRLPHRGDERHAGKNHVCGGSRFFEQVDAPERSKGEAALTLALILARAHLGIAAGGLRFGLGTTKRIVRGEMRLLAEAGSLFQALDADGHRLAIVVDEVRGCIREIGELAQEEAGRLKSRLIALDAEVRGLIAPEPVPGKPRRDGKPTE